MYKIIRGILVVYFLTTVSAVVPYTQAAFSDVPFGHPQGEAITVLSEKGLLKGNPDGTFKPTASVNRAEFLTILLRSKNEDLSSKLPASCFPDVALQAWYAAAACRGKELGIVSGGPQGKFRAGDPVTLVEAAKMLAVSQSALVEAPALTQEWYDPYLRYLERYMAIPNDMYFVGQNLTRGHVAEIVWRITEGKKDRPAVASRDLSRVPCTPPPANTIAKVNMNLVQTAWLAWYNAERAKVGAPALVIVPELNKTAQAWADTAKQRGYIDHKRGNNVYYDYNRIKSWFAGLGVTFTGKGTVYGESIAWNTYSCSAENCTDTMIDAIRASFDFFAGEKRNNGPHYAMMVNKAYKQIGLGIAVDTSSRKYYLTTHLATGVAGASLPYCPARVK